MCDICLSAGRPQPQKSSTSALTRFLAASAPVAQLPDRRRDVALQRDDSPDRAGCIGRGEHMSWPMGPDESSAKARIGLHGRKFEGKETVTVFYPENKFAEGDYDS